MSRAIVSIFVGLLVLTYVIPMDPRVYLGLTAVAAAHLIFIWKASARAGIGLHWFNLVSLGFFSMVTMNDRYGELRLLVPFAILGWGVLALGGFRAPGYGAYLGVCTMGCSSPMT